MNALPSAGFTIDNAMPGTFCAMLIPASTRNFSVGFSPSVAFSRRLAASVIVRAAAPFLLTVS